MAKKPPCDGQSWMQTSGHPDGNPNITYTAMGQTCTAFDRAHTVLGKKKKRCNHLLAFLLNSK